MRTLYFKIRTATRTGVLTAKSPRQAALEAANRVYNDIKLRGRRTKKMHSLEFGIAFRISILLAPKLIMHKMLRCNKLDSEITR